MRELNTQQKRLLEDWFNEHRTEVGLQFDLTKHDEFDIYKKLEKINNFKTLYREINKYIGGLLNERNNN